MINLIPPEGHKIVQHEFVLRVVSTILLLATSVVVCLTVALVPRYVLVNAQIQSLEAEPSETGTYGQGYAEVEKEVEDLNSMLDQFKADVTPAFSTTVIEQIKATAPDSITFEVFQVNSSENQIDAVQISGIAPTREALAQLKLDLEASPLFEKAEVPIADLVRDTNLPFTILVTLSKHK